MYGIRLPNGGRLLLLPSVSPWGVLALFNALPPLAQLVLLLVPGLLVGCALLRRPGPRALPPTGRRAR